MGEAKFDGFIYRIHPFLLPSIWCPLLVAQIILLFFVDNPETNLALIYAGLVIWFLSGIFGLWPIHEFKKRGGVPKGKSFVNTTVFVESGPYAIVRHPQYTAGILLSLAIILVKQHWVITALGIPAIILMYIDTMKADQYGVEKLARPTGSIWRGCRERISYRGWCED